MFSFFHIRLILLEHVIHTQARAHTHTHIHINKYTIDFFVSEYPSLPELPEIQLVRKENATANGTDDFSVFSLKCEVSTTQETNVKYELQWIINGAVSKTNTFTSSDATGGRFESVLSGNSLSSFQKIDQVSEIFRTCI